MVCRYYVSLRPLSRLLEHLLLDVEWTLLSLYLLRLLSQLLDLFELGGATGSNSPCEVTHIPIPSSLKEGECGTATGCDRRLL